MPLILFSFAFNPKTKEAAFTGNISPELALPLLQDIVVAQGVKRVQQAQKEKKDKGGKVR